MNFIHHLYSARRQQNSNSILSNDYLRFSNTGDFAVKFGICKVGTPYDISLEYKIDDGKWTPLPLNSKTAITLDIGQTIYLRGLNSQFSRYPAHCWRMYTEPTASQSPTPSVGSVIVSGAGITFYNGRYALVSGEHGLKSAVYEMTTVDAGQTVLCRIWHDGVAWGMACKYSSQSVWSSGYGGDSSDNDRAPWLVSWSGGRLPYPTVTDNGPIKEVRLAGSGSFGSLFSKDSSELVLDGFFFVSSTSKSVLTSAPKIPDGVVSCQEMFSSNITLTETPKLPSTLRNADYMFYHTGVTGVYLFPKSITHSDSMFASCYNFKWIELEADSWNGVYRANWLKDVADTGIFVCPSALPIERGSDAIPENWEVVKSPLCFENLSGDSSASIQLTLPDGATFPDDKVQYMLYSGKEWTQYTCGLSIQIGIDDKIFFLGSLQSDSVTVNLQIRTTGSLKAYGKLASVYAEGKAELADLTSTFKDCAGLVNLPELPESVVACAEMCSGCLKLEEVEKLPSITVADKDMTKVFFGCKSLRLAPDIPAGIKKCVSMFEGCENLLTPPVIADSVLSCNSMFKGCKALKSGPVIPAAVTDITNIFSGCKSLSFIEFEASSWVYSDNWFSELPEFGIIVHNAALSMPAKAVPIGWIEKRMVYFTNSGSYAVPVSLQKVGSPAYSASFKYYLTGNTEITDIAVDTVVFVPCGCTIAYCGDNTALSSARRSCYFFRTMADGVEDRSYDQLNIGGYADALISDDATEVNAMSLFDNVKAKHWDIKISSKSLSSISQIGYMFYSSNIDEAPAIPEGVINCAWTFGYCSHLVVPPTIPNTVNNIRSMFYSCRALETAPILPSSVVVCAGAFTYCTSLTAGPAIPANTTDCSAMFAYCSALTTAPAIPASVTNCSTMFYKCSKISYIKVGFTEWPSNTQDWVYGVSDRGRFECPTNLGTAETILRGVSYCPEKWDVLNSADSLRFKNAQASGLSSIRLYYLGTPYDISVEYSTDGIEYAAYELGYEITVPVGGSVYFRGENTHFSKDYDSYYYFIMTGRLSAHGSLGALFAGGASGINCYRLFIDCKSLVSAPAIPSCVTDCENLFRGCTSLTEAPAIPDSVSNCYGMFNGCSSLRTPPASVPSTASCGYMFYDCVSLTSSPYIDGSQDCYSMFYGCSSLSSISVGWSTWSNNTTYWVYGVAATGTFTCPDTLPIERGVSRIPEGWLVGG